MSQHNLVIFVVSASLGFASSMFASRSAANGPTYDPATMVEVVGTVTAVWQVPAEVHWKAFI